MVKIVQFCQSRCGIYGGQNLIFE